MNLVVLTPDKQIYDGAVTSVKVPGVSGQFEVLNGHAPIVSALDMGVVRIIEDNGDKKEYTIQSGFIEVINNEVAILAQGLVTS